VKTFQTSVTLMGLYRQAAKDASTFIASDPLAKDPRRVAPRDEATRTSTQP
jgi:hypothetical protein